MGEGRRARTHHVRVGDEGSAEDAVEDRVDARDGRCADERDERHAEEALERPVVLAVRLVGRGERRRVVDGALDV
mgnify:CR=1 FL=1